MVGASSHSWWQWPVFITLGWGIGLGMNAWDVYFRRPITDEELHQEIEHLEGDRMTRGAYRLGLTEMQ